MKQSPEQTQEAAVILKAQYYVSRGTLVQEQEDNQSSKAMFANSSKSLRTRQVIIIFVSKRMVFCLASCNNNNT